MGQNRYLVLRKKGAAALPRFPADIVRTRIVCPSERAAALAEKYGAAVVPSDELDRLFRLVLSNDETEVKRLQRLLEADQATAVDWFMGTEWGDNPVCRAAERKAFCSGADRLVALRQAFTSEGLAASPVEVA
jgi:hypothetical protein